jgi:hypothetical protein
MPKECCPEYSYLLLRNRSGCPFRDWGENSDPYRYSFKAENDPSYLDSNK